MSSDERYGISANKWRRVYGRTRRKPHIIEYVDSGSQETVRVDLNKTYRHRDYFQIKGINRPTAFWHPPTGSSALYEEGLVTFAGETEMTVPFVASFPTAPVVVYTVETVGDDTENINVFGTAVPTTTDMFIGLSAPFTGDIRYRAAYAPTYPKNATSIYTGSMEIDAGAVDITDATEYTASYSLTPGTIEFRATFHDSLSNSESNTGMLNDAYDETESTNSLTAPSSGKIHFIAFRL